MVSVIRTRLGPFFLRLLSGTAISSILVMTPSRNVAALAASQYTDSAMNLQEAARTIALFRTIHSNLSYAGYRDAV